MINIRTIRNLTKDIIEPENIVKRGLNDKDIAYHMGQIQFDIKRYHSMYELKERLLTVLSEEQIIIEYTYIGLLLTLRK